ncbi:hypothetical protein DYB25_011371 [Aphanomyces astaci]|uniref:Uncharacterized protein n=1 Tax=Aphanomyces astaci TaxID=112090 RepID=A0A397AXX8_APHAT|nr:hypothetical protein DYB25_011371 [Aphanomyces astaci]
MDGQWTHQRSFPNSMADTRNNTGRWLITEEVYVDLAITCFFDGILDDCDNGVTLRQYISRRLHCDDMRVTKKLRRNKVLAGRRVIETNYNRRHFVRKRKHVTQADLEAVTSMKLAYLAFEAAFREQKKPWRGYVLPTSTNLSHAASRVAIPALLNDLTIVPRRPSLRYSVDTSPH